MIIKSVKNVIFAGVIALLISNICYSYNKSCEKLRNNVYKELESLNYCKQDSDCEAVFIGCPFGCYNLVNRRTYSRQKNKIYQSYLKFKCDCGNCIYDCDVFPQAKDIRCSTQKRCVDIRYLIH